MAVSEIDALELMNGRLQRLLVAVHADDPKSEIMNRINDMMKQIPEIAALSDQVVGWQPIETAPKDKNVLVVDRGQTSEAYYDGETDTWWLANTAEHDFDHTDAIYPTLWQPLPAPPEPTPVPASTPVRSS